MCCYMSSPGEDGRDQRAETERATAAEIAVYTALANLFRAEVARAVVSAQVASGETDGALDRANAATRRRVQEARWDVDEALAAQVSGRRYPLTASPELVAQLITECLSASRSVKAIEAHAARQSVAAVA